MLLADLASNRSEYSSVAKSDYTEEQWKLLWETWPGFDKGFYKSFPDFIEKAPEYIYSRVCPKTRLTYDEAEIYESAGIKLTLHGIAGTMLTKLRNRYDGHRVTTTHLKEGSVVQITLPDIGLLYIDEVDWIDDCCTEELQGRLDDGWRILAVCPPNAQRRPDYILGRRKKND